MYRLCAVDVPVYSIVSGYVDISYTEFVLITLVCGLGLSASASRLARPAEFMEPILACVCLSAHLSVTRQYCVKAAKHVMQTILVANVYNIFWP